jgi:hypothetical protein
MKEKILEFAAPESNVSSGTVPLEFMVQINHGQVNHGSDQSWF